MSSHRRSSAHTHPWRRFLFLHGHILSFYWVRALLTTSFNLKSLPQDPSSRYSPVGAGASAANFRGTTQSAPVCVLRAPLWAFPGFSLCPGAASPPRAPAPAAELQARDPARPPLQAPSSVPTSKPAAAPGPTDMLGQSAGHPGLLGTLALSTLASWAPWYWATCPPAPGWLGGCHQRVLRLQPRVKKWAGGEEPCREGLTRQHQRRDLDTPANLGEGTWTHPPTSGRGPGHIHQPRGGDLDAPANLGEGKLAYAALGGGRGRCLGLTLCPSSHEAGAHIPGSTPGPCTARVLRAAPTRSGPFERDLGESGFSPQL